MSKKIRNDRKVNCDYCQKPAKFVGGDVVYPHRKDLRQKRFWVCEPCDARVGCHGKTDQPFGRLANAELRRAKMKAHAAFDPIWKQGLMQRSQAYKWLAVEMRMPVNKCHIGMFDVGQCAEVVQLCNAKEND